MQDRGSISLNTDGCTDSEGFDLFEFILYVIFDIFIFLLIPIEAILSVGSNLSLDLG